MTPQQIPSILLDASRAFDSAMRRLNPLMLSDLRGELLAHLAPLQEARKCLQTENTAIGDETVRAGLLRACDFLATAIRNFAHEEDLQAAYIASLRAARKHCRAMEALFPLCSRVPEVNRYFLEMPVKDDAIPKNASPVETGLFHIGHNRDLHARGGYSLFLPDDFDPATPSPLIVALHGGYSHGRDFIWTWLAHARSRGYIIFAPTSSAMSWSIGHAAADGASLMKNLEDIFFRFNVDPSRILLSGMSDGGTYALDLALSAGSIFSWISCAACALAPVDLRQARGKHIFWIHGAQDWIFPVSQAIDSGKRLKAAGADMRMKVLPDLSHAYPGEENSTVMDWFEGKAGRAIP